MGVKIGPSVTSDQVLRLLDTLNPSDEPGKIALITRMGATKVGDVLPGLVEAIQRSGRTVLWVCDPMHGNTQVAPSGVKTRVFDDILREVELTFDVHEGCEHAPWRRALRDDGRRRHRVRRRGRRRDG